MIFQVLVNFSLKYVKMDKNAPNWYHIFEDSSHVMLDEGIFLHLFVCILILDIDNCQIPLYFFQFFWATFYETFIQCFGSQVHKH